MRHNFACVLPRHYADPAAASLANTGCQTIPHSGDIGGLATLTRAVVVSFIPNATFCNSLQWGIATAIARRYPAAMETAASHTFEVKSTADGRYAVFVDGVCIAGHEQKVDAVAHCERLQRQAVE
jgi:hypothetical protein